MKTSGYLVLYISENDDFELWRALCQFTPEERASVVKEVLKKGLLSPIQNQTTSNPSFSNQESSFTSNQLRPETEIPKYPTPKSAFGFNAQSAATLAPEVADHKTAGASSSASSSPLEDLVFDEFGTGLADSLTDEELTNSELTDFNELNIFLQPEDSPRKSSIPGLDFLLNNVIGEENDETVVEYIRRLKVGNDKEDEHES